MRFHVNSSFLYGIGVCIVVFVLAQSIFFLIRAYKRGKELGIATSKLKNTIVSTTIFAIAPAISILIGIVTLSKFLGIPLPWIRMSVIGAITYELPAATSTAKALNISLSETITNPTTYAAIAWVMTLGIMPSIIMPPILMKKIQGGMGKLKQKDSKWSDIFMTSLFLGMISAFLGMVFANVREGLVGWIPVFVLLVSAGFMLICGFFIKVCKWKWLETYALAISMVGAMIFAVLVTPLIA